MSGEHSLCPDSKQGMAFVSALANDAKDCHRKKNVRKKLNAMALEFVNKVVLLVDGILPLLYRSSLSR
jgi:hypothetical protein